MAERDMPFNDDERRILFVGSHGMHSLVTPRPVESYDRFGPNIESRWKRDGDGGDVGFELGEAGRLELKWWSYRLGQRLGHIGTLFYGDAPIEVEEVWTSVVVTNSGTYVREGRRASVRFCCDELLEAARTNSSLLARESHFWAMQYDWEKNVIWHDCDLHRGLVRLEIDLGRCSGRLRRASFTDVST
jgi:hypothetical protein